MFPRLTIMCQEYPLRRLGNRPHVPQNVNPQGQRRSWRIICMILGLSVLPLSVHADPAPPLRNWGDAMTSLTLGLGWLVPAVGLKPASLSMPHLSIPNDPKELFAIDRIAVGPRNLTLSKVSDGMVFGLLAGAAAQAAWLARDSGTRGRSAATVESLLLTGAVVEWLKVSVGRSRPYSYDHVISPKDDFAHRSFPSGHTAMAFGAALALTLSWRDNGFLNGAGGKAAAAGIWAAAASTASLRVASSSHFPTDVLASSGIAVLCGVIVEGVRWKAAHR